MKKITFLIIGLIALVACEAELETEKANSMGDANSMTRNGLTISPEEAAAQALEFRNDIMEQSGQTRGQKAEKGVTSVYAWRSSEIAPKSMTRSTASELLPDTLLYIVNFEDSCGYALVSADALVPGVAAYIEKGNLSPDQEIDNPGFKSFLEGYGKYICDSIRSISDSLRHHEGTLMFMDTAHVTGPEPYTPYHLIYYVAPLLTTSWNQTDPYNYNCGQFDPNNPNAHNKAGCVAIAIAQVAAYYRYPTSYSDHSYNWDAILEDHHVYNDNVEGCSSVAELIHDIGLLVNMNYGMIQSSARFDSISYCLDTFGYHYDYQRSQVTNFNTINEDVSNGHPVIIMGGTSVYDRGGHAWVVDGVAIKRHRFNAFQSIPDREYIHCNWGDGGLFNGFFIMGAFQTMVSIETDYAGTTYTNYGFNFNNYAYHQIYPIGN